MGWHIEIDPLTGNRIQVNFDRTRGSVRSDSQVPHAGLFYARRTAQDERALHTPTKPKSRPRMRSRVKSM